MAWNGSGWVTQGPSATSGGGLLPGYTWGPNGTAVPITGGTTSSASPYSAIPSAGTSTRGGTTSSSNTIQQAGPQGPFAGLGPQLSGNASNVMNAGNTVLNTAFDPQKTLYNQQFRQQQDQTNVNEAQRGVTMSPYGAGVANQADINFNSNWQNQQLSRQAQGIDAASKAMSPATTLYNSSYGSGTTGYNSGGGGSTATRAAASGGTTDPQPSLLPYGTQQPLGVSSVPYTQTASPPSQPSNLYGGTTGQGYTGSTSYMTPSGQDYNQIVNPTAYQNSGATGVFDQYTGGDTSQYPLYGSTDATNYDPYDPSNIGNLLNPQSSVINQSGIDYNQIMGISNDASAIDYLANW